MKMCPLCGCEILWRRVEFVEAVNGPNDRTNALGVREGDYPPDRPITCDECGGCFEEDDAAPPKNAAFKAIDRIAAIERHLQHSKDCTHGRGFTYDFCPVVHAEPPEGKAWL